MTTTKGHPMTRTISTRISYSGNGVWLAEATDGHGFVTDHGSWHTIWMNQGTYYSADDAARACSRASERGWA